MEELFSAAVARSARPLPTLVARCDRCRLHEGCKSKKMRPDGENRRRVLILAEYPGEEEDEQGKPLVGGTGRFLAEEFRALGYDMRRDCVLHNAIACHAPNAASHKSAVTDCRPNVLRAIKDYDPLVIVLMGGAAVRSVIGHYWKEDTGGAGRWAGYRIPNHKPNVWICPTFNPAHVLRAKKEKDQVTPQLFREHLRSAMSLESRPWSSGPPDYQKRCESVYDPTDAARRLRRITGGCVAFDFETNCLKPDAATSEIVCCSVCWDGEETFAFPWHGEAKKAAAELFANRAVAKFGWNAKFEDRWVRRACGVEVMGWAWDGMMAAHATDPRRGVTGLKFQAFARLGCPDYSSHLENMLGADGGGYALNEVHKIESRVLFKYCALDSLLEYEMARLQMKELGYADV